MKSCACFQTAMQSIRSSSLLCSCCDFKTHRSQLLFQGNTCKNKAPVNSSGMIQIHTKPELIRTCSCSMQEDVFLHLLLGFYAGSEDRPLRAGTVTDVCTVSNTCFSTFFTTFKASLNTCHMISTVQLPCCKHPALLHNHRIT